MGKMLVSFLANQQLTFELQLYYYGPPAWRFTQQQTLESESD